MVGPAGTGKATALAPAVRHLQATGPAMFGVTPDAAAAQVLAAATGITSDTLDKLLYSTADPTGSPDPAFALPLGTTVVVDEAGAVSTPNSPSWLGSPTRSGRGFLLIGGPRQFSAWAGEGCSRRLVSTYGRRARPGTPLHAPLEEERHLRLRGGDPSTLIEYDGRGRLHGGPHADLESGNHGWRPARGRRETVALMASATKPWNGSTASPNRPASTKANSIREGPASHRTAGGSRRRRSGNPTQRSAPSNRPRSHGQGP